jgi:UDP-GlcNAc:undecaprenyl-phosphate GlcNAc-1-phosphate transferase
MRLIFSLGVSAFVCALVLTPVLRDTFKRMGFVDRPDGSRKRHTQPVPRVGGIAIAISYLAAFGIFLFPPLNETFFVKQFASDVWFILLAAAIVFSFGLVDDLRGLKPVQKLAGQLIASLIAYGAGVQIHVDSAHPLDPLISIPLTIIWLIGCANAFNLIDGLDGLATGVGLFATITVLLAGLMQSNIELIVVTVPLVGALLGFLRYNFNPATVFLGDCGSMLIGFLLGCFGLLWSQKSATLLGMTAPLMALCICSTPDWRSSAVLAKTADFQSRSRACSSQAAGPWLRTPSCRFAAVWHRRPWRLLFLAPGRRAESIRRSDSDSVLSCSLGRYSKPGLPGIWHGAPDPV